MVILSSNIVSFLSNIYDFNIFSFLALLIRTANIMLKKTDYNDHPCFTPNLKGSIFRIPPFNITLVNFIKVRKFKLDAE